MKKLESDDPGWFGEPPQTPKAPKSTRAPKTTEAPKAARAAGASRSRRRAPAAVAEAEPEVRPDEVPPPSLEDLRAAGVRFVREHPLLSVGLALGAGFLLGRIKR